MNENLMKLKALVTETNQVVTNLKNETNAIENDNQIVRAKKFEKIRDYLLECYEVVKELNKDIRVRVNNFEHFGDQITNYIDFNPNPEHRCKPIIFIGKYIDRHGHEDSYKGDCYGIDTETVWRADREQQYIFGCWWSAANEKSFVDNWDQNDFEKKFAIEIEKAITEKANKANEKYQYVTNNSQLLRR